MIGIIPDQVLDNLLCSQCDKYLSVLPVYQYPNRTTKCGRCVKYDENGALSLVNQIIPKMLFKCVNRYEGCTSLLFPQQMKEHEQKCVGKVFHSCPVCFQEKISPYMILRHYEKMHSKYILKKPLVEINPTTDSDKFYLYCNENNIFMINVTVDTVYGTIFINNKLIGSKEVAKTITHQCRLFNITSDVQNCDINFSNGHQFAMEKFKNFDNIYCEIMLNYDQVQFPSFKLRKIENNNLEIKKVNGWFCRKLYLPPNINTMIDTFKLSACKTYINRNNLKFQMFCSYCGMNLYSKPIYCFENCPDPTVCCDLCKSGVRNTCSMGHQLNKGFLQGNKLYLETQAYCKWNCGQHFNCLDLYKHEEDCTNRKPIQNCLFPKCTVQNFKNFTELKRHFKMHGNSTLYPHWDSTHWQSTAGNDTYVYLDHVTAVLSSVNNTVHLKKIIKYDSNLSFKVFLNDRQIGYKKVEHAWKTPVDIRIIQDFVVTCE